MSFFSFQDTHISDSIHLLQQSHRQKKLACQIMITANIILEYSEAYRTYENMIQLILNIFISLSPGPECKTTCHRWNVMEGNLTTNNEKVKPQRRSQFE